MSPIQPRRAHRRINPKQTAQPCPTLLFTAGYRAGFRSLTPAVAEEDAVACCAPHFSHFGSSGSGWAGGGGCCGVTPATGSGVLSNEIARGAVVFASCKSRFRVLVYSSAEISPRASRKSSAVFASWFTGSGDSEVGAAHPVGCAYRLPTAVSVVSAPASGHAQMRFGRQSRKALRPTTTCSAVQTPPNFLHRNGCGRRDSEDSQ